MSARYAQPIPAERMIQSRSVRNPISQFREKRVALEVIAPSFGAASGAL